MKKKIVYIAHPIGGDVENNLKQLRSIYTVLTLQNEVIPFIPYYATVMSLDDNNPTARKWGFEHNEAIFNSGIIDEVWLFGPKISNGMQTEIEWAKKLNIPVVSVSEGTALWV
jgi:hypothetical protein